MQDYTFIIPDNTLKEGVSPLPSMHDLSKMRLLNSILEERGN